MTPDFALSLSFDGIALLHRVPDGWHLVGEVPLDAPDLDAALADLRAKGLALSPSGLRTKLVIPGDQIRYMTLDSDQATDADVRQALDGATPYALDELVIDAVRAGGRTHVAAVARETLEEAEAFAVEHDFSPVAWVALPDADTVAQEVFFGATRAAGSTPVTRDSRPVVQTGIAEDPKPQQPAAGPEVPAAQVDEEPAAKDAEPVFASRSKVAAPTIDPVRAPLAAGAMPGGPVPASVTARIRPGAATPVGRDAATAGVGLPGGGQASVTPVPPPTAEPLFTRRKEPPPAVAGKGRAASPAALRAEAPAAAPVAALTAAAAPMEPRGPVAGPAPRPGNAAAALTAASPSRGRPRFMGLILTAVLLLVLLLVGLWANTLSPEGIAGWFRRDAAPAPTIAVADITTPETVAAAPAPAAENIAPSAILPQEVAVAAPPLPVVRAPAGRVLSPDEADRIYAATGVYQRAPRIAGIPDSDPQADVAPIATVAAPDVADQPDMPPLDAAAPDAVIAAQLPPPGPDVVFDRDARGNILATAEGIVTPQGAIVIAGAPEVRPVLRPGTPRVPQPPITPVARPADLVPAAPEEAAAPAPATPPAADADQTQATVPPATPLDAEDADLDAPVFAFTEGPPPLRPTLRPIDAAARAAPDSLIAAATPAPIWTGTRPRLRPDGLVAVAAPPAAAEAAIAAYTGARPVLRPAGLAPAAPEVEPETVVAADINAVAAAIAAAAPVTSFRNRTALAVSVAPRPAPRPRNFAQVVARARQAVAPPPAAAPAPAPTRTAAVAATPAPPTIVAPSGAVPGGVARAATIDNAMNLRQMNLVGVYGKPNARRALIRLGNGRYVKVEVGSALDGGQVTAIGDSALNFVKRGKVYALTLPG